MTRRTPDIVVHHRPPVASADQRTAGGTSSAWLRRDHQTPNKTQAAACRARATRSATPPFYLKNTDTESLVQSSTVCFSLRALDILIWYPRKAAMRAGSVFGNQWDDSNIGLYSTAVGYRTVASGHSSSGMGDQNVTRAEGAATTGHHSTFCANHEACGMTCILAPREQSMNTIQSIVFVIGCVAILGVAGSRDITSSSPHLPVPERMCIGPNIGTPAWMTPCTSWDLTC